MQDFKKATTIFINITMVADKEEEQEQNPDWEIKELLDSFQIKIDEENDGRKILLYNPIPVREKLNRMKKSKEEFVTLSNEWMGLTCSALSRSKTLNEVQEIVLDTLDKAIKKMPCKIPAGKNINYFKNPVSPL